jgi:SRSO17 transposase
VRRWDGWYRHMTLAMFALAYLAVLRLRVQAQQIHQEPVTLAETATEVAKGGLISSRST